MISVVPVDLLLRQAPGVTGTGYLFKLFRMLRFIKLLRLARSQSVMARFEETLGSAPWFIMRTVTLVRNRDGDL
jgi:hypothetical protein